MLLNGAEDSCSGSVGGWVGCSWKLDRSGSVGGWVGCSWELDCSESVGGWVGCSWELDCSGKRWRLGALQLGA